ncbi:glutamate receptor 1-like [Haliotis cracherodii]|uniref:glutamate receptor 1-like n=1 Tax=Haliotis cracherodii TaxID=6455 RepID=UPI0039E73757
MRKLSEHNSGIFLNNRTSHMIRVKEGTHAHITYRAIAAKYMAEDCRLALIGDPITWAEERISFGILKGSTLKPDLDKVMYKLKESGLLEEWWKQWNARDTASSSCEDDSSSVRTITLREVGGGFLVVCGGLGLSSLVLIVEICRQRLQRKSN